ncbi:hypothetical protein ILUMI_14996 [Ignelater luminosus]|uniref:Uncharacterized protein n=1 Tax=Ignelater luminosus TaxID=2038154 RepID=A0A8K0G7A0_IGNLU|nr:hypothetical protein ILUMI_14996 [Ignelater luminosus]
MDIRTLPVSVIFKWGCYGSSGHSRYKQRWTEEHDTHDDSYMQLPARKKSSFSKDVVSLLEDPSFLICTVDSSSDENEDSNVESDDD